MFMSMHLQIYRNKNFAIRLDVGLFTATLSLALLRHVWSVCFVLKNNVFLIEPRDVLEHSDRMESKM